MSSGETILGIIHGLEGGAFIEVPAEYAVIMTEIRVIFARIPERRPRTYPSRNYPYRNRDYEFVLDELEADSLSYRQLDWIIDNLADFYMGYEEIKELQIYKAGHKGKLSFLCGDNIYDFEIPVEQYPMVDRLESLWKSINELKECPECGGRLAGPLKYCKDCDKKYNEEILKLKKGFLTEPAVEIEEGDKWTGLILIFGGLFMFFMIVAVLGDALGGGGYILSYFCFPFPLFFIILGILIYKGKRSGKLILGIVLIIFGALGLAASIMGIFTYDNDTYDTDEPTGYSFLGISIVIIVYGYHLARRNWKN